MKFVPINAAIIVLCLTGCGGGLRNKIVGKWKFDPASLTMPNITQATRSQFGARVGGNGLELKADGTYVQTSAGKPGETGKWSLDGNKLIVTPDVPADAANEPALTVNGDGTRIHASVVDAGFDVDLVKG